MKYFILVLAIFCAPIFAQSSSSSAKASSSSASSIQKINVRFSWSVPTQREGGEPFYPEEIASYEVRYKPISGIAFKEVVNINPAITKYYINNVPDDDYYIEIRCCDLWDLCSAYVSLQYNRPPKPVVVGIAKASPVTPK